MSRILAFASFVLVLTVANSQQSSAWVILHDYPKGTVPVLVGKGQLRDALSKTLPLGGSGVDGMAHQSFTLYYRGTQQSTQQFIDDLADVPNLSFHVQIDSSGKVGRVEATRSRGRILYQMRIHIGVTSRIGMPIEAPAKWSVLMTIHPVGGIDADKLSFPEGVLVATKQKAKPAK